MAGADPGDPGDIFPRATWYRDGREIAIGFADGVDAERGLQMMTLGIAGFWADRVETVFDARSTDNRFEQEHGRDPYPGELQRLAAQGLNYITDTLICPVIWRTGRTAIISLPYNLTSSDDGQSVVWHEDQAYVVDSALEGDGTAESGGRLINVLTGAFMLPPFEPDDPAATRLDLDHAVIGILVTLGFAVVAPAGSEDEARLLRERMAAHENVRMINAEGEIELDRSAIPVDVLAEAVVDDTVGAQWRDVFRAQADLNNAARNAMTGDELRRALEDNQ